MGVGGDGYIKAIVICHGKSELDIIKHIKSKFWGIPKRRCSTDTGCKLISHRF